MHQPSRRDRHARRPALEPYEDRILQSVTFEPVGGAAVQPQISAHADGSRIVVLSEPTVDHSSRIFDDPFFFDVN